MSEFSDTPMSYETEQSVSDAQAEDILRALDMGGEAEEEPADDITPDGENYPDTEPEEEDDEGFEDETEDADDEEEEEDEEKTEEDEADEEVQSVVEDLQKQADACAKFLGGKGIDYNALREEYLADGKLSKNSLKALADIGIDEELITGYIEGQQSRYEIYAQHVKAIAGGEKEYDKLMAWADKNLSEKEKKHFNKAVESNDVDEARLAVKGLVAMRDKARGARPQLVHGRTASGAPKGIKPFRSLKEQADAQADPRYEFDPEYTRMVDRRIMASNY